MKTIQGKEYDFSDVILYNHSDSEMIMMVNDQENLEKFKHTGNPDDAPVIIIPYNEETEKQTISNMKKILEYKVLESVIEVTYKDNTKVVFDLSNEEVVKNNLEAQNKLAKETIATSINNISEEEKNIKKQNTIEKLKKQIVTILANLTIVGDEILSKSKKVKKKTLDEGLFINRQYSDNSRKLYQDIIDKNSLVLRYQQVINVNWDENIALSLIELLNNSNITSIQNMNFENSVNEIKKILQLLIIVIYNNLSPETAIENMINLTEYIDNEKDKVLVHNSMVIARNAVNELFGEQTIIPILDESNYSTINKFSNEYKGAVNQLLNYEFKTMNDREFLILNKSSRWIIISIFELVNSLISDESSIDIEVAGSIKKMYYRYFVNNIENKIYVPIIGTNGIEYYEYKTKQMYSREDMFAVAGLSLLDNNIEPNPNIHEVGIHSSIEEKFNSISEEIYNID